MFTFFRMARLEGWDDGFYLAELWRRDPHMRDVPLIAISAFTEGDYEKRALESGSRRVGGPRE